MWRRWSGGIEMSLAKGVEDIVERRLGMGRDTRIEKRRHPYTGVERRIDANFRSGATGNIP